MPDGLTLEEAKQAIANGAKFGSVYPMLGDPGDGETLKAFFVFGEPTRPKEKARDMGYTGDVCGTCGSTRMRRAGVCLVCEACGSTSGGCA